MSSPTFSILLKIFPPKGFAFYKAKDAEEMEFLGYPIDVWPVDPDLAGDQAAYLKVRGIPHAHANDVFENLKTCLRIAAVGLGFGVQPKPGDLSFVEGELVDGSQPIAFEGDKAPSILEGSVLHVDGFDGRNLLHFLNEASRSPAFENSEAGARLDLALEIYESVEFEATANAKFVSLTSIVEILAEPQKRPQACLDVIDRAIAEMDYLVAESKGETKEALCRMRDSASMNWKNESINSSVKRLAAEAAEAAGDEDPKAFGREATRLYGIRSKLVHRGESVSEAALSAMRKLVNRLLKHAVGF